MSTTKATTHDLESAIRQWFDDNAIGKHPAFYTQNEWESRGQTMCKDAPAHIVLEGTSLRNCIEANWHMEPEQIDECNRLHESFTSMLAGLGYWYENGYLWSMHFYQLINARDRHWKAGLMTRDEFIQKYRGRFLLFLTEAWACRTHKPSELGMLMDGHSKQLERLLDDIYAKHVSPTPLPNGTAPRVPAGK